MSKDEKYSIVLPLNWTHKTFHGSQSTTTNVGSFYETLLNFFKPYVEAECCTGIIECIRNSVKYLAPYINSEYMVSLYLDFIFCLFEIFRCTNSIVIRNSLEELIVYTLKRNNLLTPKFEIPSLLNPVRVTQYNMVSGCVKELTTDSFFYEPFLLKDDTSVQTLLRYGVRFELEDEALRHYLRFMSSILPQYMFSKEINEELEDALKAAIESNYATYSERRRLYFVLLATELVLLKQKHSEYSKYFAESIKLVFKTITDPLITVTEFLSFCDLMTNGMIEVNDIPEFLDLFLEEFPKADAPFQPRALQHLSRCRVRECLIGAKKLPHGVWSLHIPELLENYILLQERRDQFYHNFVFDLTSNKKTFNFGTGERKRRVLL